MELKERGRHKKHVDDVEIWKRKSLMAASNRKKLLRLLNIVMLLAAVSVVAVCVWAYFFDR